jgi:hypothetical protein
MHVGNNAYTSGVVRTFSGCWVRNSCGRCSVRVTGGTRLVSARFDGFRNWFIVLWLWVQAVVSGRGCGGAA